tara:strand:- start:7840 stop:8385 length:546 start_codon:yes stop_codon:yes gene_type:complete
MSKSSTPKKNSPKTSKKNKANGVKSPQKKENLKDLKKQIDLLEDKYLRLKAEFDNFRRRKSEEISKILLYDGENILKSFLPIFDDLQRTIAASERTSGKNPKESIKEGLSMVNNKLEKFLENNNIKRFGSIGDLVDPELHDAMMTKYDEKKEENTILEVFENGFTYREKVIRHAKVIVNKK